MKKILSIIIIVQVVFPLLGNKIDTKKNANKIIINPNLIETKQNRVKLYNSWYFIESKDLEQIKKSNDLQVIKMHTLFNRVIETDSKIKNTNYVFLGASFLATITPLYLSSFYYNKYQKTDSTTEAKNYKKKTKNCGYISILGFAGLIYNGYQMIKGQ